MIMFYEKGVLIWPAIALSLAFHALLFLIPVRLPEMGAFSGTEARFVFVEPKTSPPAPSASRNEPRSLPDTQPLSPPAEPQPIMRPRPQPETNKNRTEPSPAIKPPKEPRQQSRSAKPEPAPTANSSSQNHRRQNDFSVPEAPAAVLGKTGSPLQTTFGTPDGPKFLHRVVPEYPWKARRKGKEGTVVIDLHIDADGRLQATDVIQDPGFGMAEAAKKAVGESTYLPARRHEEKVASKARIHIRFKLN